MQELSTPESTSLDPVWKDHIEKVKSEKWQNKQSNTKLDNSCINYTKQISDTSTTTQ